MTPIDDKGVHTHDFRHTGRCVCGELAENPVPVPLPVPVPETDWKEYAADYLSNDPERMKKYLPEWMQETVIARIHTTETPDMEVRAEIWNEGFDTAHRQGVGGELSAGWLLGKLDPIFARLRGTIKAETIDNMITEIIETVLDDSLVHDADSDTRPDQQRGMYGKYFVERLHDPEGKHANDRFFVLDPVHDPVALTALKTYAMVCAEEYPKLAEDLREWIGDVEGSFE